MNLTALGLIMTGITPPNAEGKTKKALVDRNGKIVAVLNEYTTVDEAARYVDKFLKEQEGRLQNGRL